MTPEIDARVYIQASLYANRAIIIFVSMAIDISAYLLVIVGVLRGEEKMKKCQGFHTFMNTLTSRSTVRQ